MRKSLKEFDVVFINADNDKEVSLVAKASEYLESKCGLKCAIPARDYMYGVIEKLEMKYYFKECKSMILTYSVLQNLDIFDDDKNMVVLTENLEICSIDLRHFIPLEVSTCEHIWLYHLAKVLVLMSPSK